LCLIGGKYILVHKLKAGELLLEKIYLILFQTLFYLSYTFFYELFSITLCIGTNICP
jgi:hypothetical protein